MRVHTDVLDVFDFWDAADTANRNLRENDIDRIVVADITEHGSRVRRRSFEVLLSGDSSRNVQNHDYKAATWDQWGEFLAALFDADETVTIPKLYESKDHFHWVTSGRYALAGSFEYCRQHSWQNQGTHANGAFTVHRCKRCDAFVRQGDWELVR